MKINCISCGHKVDLGDDYDDYDGQIKCWVCGAILAIKTIEGSVKSSSLVSIARRPSLEEEFDRIAYPKE